MNIKNKNKNGFTLVELVVVMCIFGIIMGAILNFIKPANDVHNDAQATMDANVISSGLIEYMDDELRYATNVLVLQDYYGVPQVSDSGYVGTYGVPFNNCLVIDNKNFRGYSTPGYSGSDDDRVDKRVGATGCIIKVNKLDTEGFNFNNSRVVKGEDFYDKFKFNIKVGTNIDSSELAEDHYYDPSLKSIQVSMVTSYPVWENGGYVFKKKFDRGTEGSNEAEKTKDRGAVISLTNINTDISGFNIEYVDLSDITLQPAQLAAVLSGKGYPPASAPAGATAQQQTYYGADAGRYTYIFYKKVGKSSEAATGCTIKFVTDVPTANTQVSSPVNGFTKGDYFKAFPSAPIVSGYSSSYWLAPDGTEVNNTTGYPINGDTTFKLVYVPDPEPSLFHITWINADGSSYQTNGPTPVGKTATNGNPPIGFDPDKFAINDATSGWVEQGTGKTLDQVPVDRDVVFVADLLPKYEVKFDYPDAQADVTIKVVKGKFATPPEAVPNPPAADKIFDKWVVSGTTNDIATTAITGNTTFTPTFKNKPSEISGWTITSTVNNVGTQDYVWDFNIGQSVTCVKYDVNITFNSTNASAQIKGYKVKVTLNKAGNLCSYYNLNVSGNGTTTLTLEPTMWGNISSGGSHNLNNVLYLRDTSVKIEKIELVSVTAA